MLFYRLIFNKMWFISALQLLHFSTYFMKTIFTFRHSNTFIASTISLHRYSFTWASSQRNQVSAFSRRFPQVSRARFRRSRSCVHVVVGLDDDITMVALPTSMCCCYCRYCCTFEVSDGGVPNKHFCMCMRFPRPGYFLLFKINHRSSHSTSLFVELIGHAKGY